MKLDGRRESTNVDDRRGKSTGTKVGIGIGGTIVAALLALLLGGDPSSVIQSLNNQQSASAAEPYQPSAEEEELATFAKQILDLIAELVDDPMSSEEALKIVNLEDKYSNYPSELSGGQQQRVSIARALVKKPTLIFADEPTAALDYKTSIDVLSVLEKVISKGTTLVMVTHNEEITRMADRVVRIRDGKVYEITVNRERASASELVW